MAAWLRLRSSFCPESLRSSFSRWCSPDDDRTNHSFCGALFRLRWGLACCSGACVPSAVKGRGTLAPWDLPQGLVVSSAYRVSRNPDVSWSHVGALGLGPWVSLRSLAVVVALVMVAFSSARCVRRRTVVGENARRAVDPVQGACAALAGHSLEDCLEAAKEWIGSKIDPTRPTSCVMMPSRQNCRRRYTIPVQPFVNASDIGSGLRCGYPVGGREDRRRGVEGRTPGRRNGRTPAAEEGACRSYPVFTAELCSWTFWTFAREFSPFPDRTP
jgi:hypothetical protein